MTDKGKSIRKQNQKYTTPEPTGKVTEEGHSIGQSEGHAVGHIVGHRKIHCKDHTLNIMSRVIL